MFERTANPDILILPWLSYNIVLPALVFIKTYNGIPLATLAFGGA